MDSKSVCKFGVLGLFPRRGDMNLHFNSFKGYEMGGQQKKQILYFNAGKPLWGVDTILQNEYGI